MRDLAAMSMRELDALVQVMDERRAAIAREQALAEARAQAHAGRRR